VELGRLSVRLLGAASVIRDGAVVALPKSRKVRALFAYLALSPRPVLRSRLCDLLWDVPNDPRGELRWCLSKLRAVLDEPRRRVVTEGDTVMLDLSDCRVDALEVRSLAAAELEQLSQERLAEVCDVFAGDLLDGLEIDGSPEFTTWLTTQRAHYRALHVAVLRVLAIRAETGDRFRRLETWLQLAPLDPEGHRMLLETLVRGGRLRDGEQHLAATIRAFEQEGVDWAPLRDAWREARQVSTIEVTARSAEPPAQRHASVAVMPFADHLSSDRERIADGLTEDIIMQLAKLRVLFVIARGSVFALRERGIGPDEAAKLLDVEYVVSGSVRRDGGNRIAVMVELTDTDGRIVWTDAFHGESAETAGLASIIDRIVAAIAEEIETAECRRAVLKPPSSLDAWGAYHRGLWHMYKFTGPDNRLASELFRTALGLDPTFARAHAGLSFTHFQNAFLDLTPDREHQIALAYETAAHSIGADDHDPAAHWAMGRALWLRGEQSASIVELERSVELSPNFALGHYTLGFVHAQQGDARSAIDATNTSRQLSPFDPLQFGMLGSRALAHVRLDEYEEAAEWGVKATGRPNAHAHILAIAAMCLVLAERRDEARAFVGRIRERIPSYTVDDFLRAFRFDPDIQHRFRRGAARIGFGHPP